MGTDSLLLTPVGSFAGATYEGEVSTRRAERLRARATEVRAALGGADETDPTLAGSKEAW